MGFLAVGSAVAGALAGSFLTWWFQLRKEARERIAAVQAKLHELELRMVRLEAELGAINLIGSRDAPEPEGMDA